MGPAIKGNPLEIFGYLLVISYVVGEFFIPKYNLFTLLNLLGVIGLVLSLALFFSSLNIRIAKFVITINLAKFSLNYFGRNTIPSGAYFIFFYSRMIVQINTYEHQEKNEIPTKFELNIPTNTSHDTPNKIILTFIKTSGELTIKEVLYLSLIHI